MKIDPLYLAFLASSEYSGSVLKSTEGGLVGVPAALGTAAAPAPHSMSNVAWATRSRPFTLAGWNLHEGTASRSAGEIEPTLSGRPFLSTSKDTWTIECSPTGQ